MLTQERVKELFDYDPEVGDLIRKVRTSSRRNKGEVAGYHHPNGYIYIKIDSGKYLIHRVIFIHVTGSLPVNEVDHINGKKDDNRWCNLRDVTKAENLKNKKLHKNNTSGVCGVGYDKGQKAFRARISDGKRKDVHIGYFKNFDDAVKARRNAEESNGYHKNHGRS